MRSFLIACLIAITVAAPQGYNYNQGGSQYTGGSIGHHQGSFSFSAAPVLPAFNHHAQAVHHHQPQRQHLPPIISKNFYIHSAPEEPDEEIFEDNSSEQQRKHYNVVFIKAPHQTVRKTALSVAQALNEEKTAIYVLSKKNDVSEIRQALQDAPHHPIKPEVFFIKYKTPEEAHHAQQTIQAQYDALGGSTHVSDEGYAPISSVIGALGHGGSGGSSGFSSGGSSGGSFVGSASDNFISSGNIGNANYLPPSRIK